MRFLLLLICALLPLGNSFAATATATWSFTDALGRPLRSKPVRLTPLFYTTLDGTNYVVTDPIFGTTDTNGQYAATNVLLGYGYRAQVTGYAATAVTNYFPPDIAGQSVAAAAYTFTYATTTNFAYTMPQADSRFAPLAVTNVANTNTINALAGVQAAAAVAPYTNQVTASAVNAAVPNIVTNLASPTFNGVLINPATVTVDSIVCPASFTLTGTAQTGYTVADGAYAWEDEDQAWTHYNPLVHLTSDGVNWKLSLTNNINGAAYIYAPKNGLPFNHGSLVWDQDPGHQWYARGGTQPPTPVFAVPTVSAAATVAQVSAATNGFTGPTNDFYGTFIGSGAGLTSLPAGVVTNIVLFPDGTNDQSDAIQAAFSTPNATILFQPGDYYATNLWLSGSNQSVIGWGATLHQIYASSQDGFVSGADNLFYLGQTNFNALINMGGAGKNKSIIGLTVDGGRSSDYNRTAPNYDSTYAIYINASSGVYPLFHPFGTGAYTNNYGILVEQSAGGVVTGCRAFNFGAAGFYLSNNRDQLAYKAEITAFPDNSSVSNFCGFSWRNWSKVGSLVYGNAEYSMGHGLQAANCTWGFDIGASNTRLDYSSATDCYVGLCIAAGNINAGPHTRYSNITLNHNWAGFWIGTCDIVNIDNLYEAATTTNFVVGAGNVIFSDSQLTSTFISQAATNTTKQIVLDNCMIYGSLTATNTKLEIAETTVSGATVITNCLNVDKGYAGKFTGNGEGLTNLQPEQVWVTSGAVSNLWSKIGHVWTCYFHEPSGATNTETMTTLASIAFPAMTSNAVCYVDYAFQGGNVTNTISQLMVNATAAHTVATASYPTTWEGRKSFRCYNSRGFKYIPSSTDFGQKSAVSATVQDLSTNSIIAFRSSSTGLTQTNTLLWCDIMIVMNP